MMSLRMSPMGLLYSDHLAKAWLPGQRSRKVISSCRVAPYQQWCLTANQTQVSWQWSSPRNHDNFTKVLAALKQGVQSRHWKGLTWESQQQTQTPLVHFLGPWFWAQAHVPSVCLSEDSRASSAGFFLWPAITGFNMFQSPYIMLHQYSGNSKPCIWSLQLLFWMFFATCWLGNLGTPSLLGIRAEVLIARHSRY